MLKIFRYFTKREWTFVFVCVVLIVFQVYIDLLLPDYMSRVTTLTQTPTSQPSEILTAGVTMLFLALLSLGSATCVGFLGAKVAASLAMVLRGEVFDKTMSFSLQEMSGFSTASLITRCTNDITQIQMIVAIGLQALIKAPLVAGWALYKIAGKNIQFTLVTAVFVVIIAVLFAVIITLVLPRSKKIQAMTDTLNGVTREHLTGLAVIRAFNSEQYQRTRFKKANTQLVHTNLFVNRMTALIAPFITTAMSGLTLAIYTLGAVIINETAVEERLMLFSDMVVFTSYAMQIIFAFMLITIVFIMLPRAFVSAGRVMEVLETKVTVTDGYATKLHEGAIQFEKVSFTYPGAKESVLKDISFSVPSGDTVAIIGSTGSGKTTLVNLITRLYDATNGSVSVGGTDVKSYDTQSLRTLIGYVTQKATIFSGTVLSNVTYSDKTGTEPDMHMVNMALDISNAREFVDRIGLNGVISQGGANISGGQKQRLSIARAVYKKPKIYIFDDSFSALDYKTDRSVRSALARHTKGATKLIVAQRIGTIKDADNILVMDKGRIVGEGKHSELLKSCAVYKEIALSQLSQEELDNG